MKHLHRRRVKEIFPYRGRMEADWSRTNLEGRSLYWTGARVLPSVFVAVESNERNDLSRWTQTADVLVWEDVWRQ